MKNRSFEAWLDTFRPSISDYGYYIDFDRVHDRVEKIKVELNILNSLIGTQDIENDFDRLVEKYPETLKCVPILLAVREKEIQAMDAKGDFIYNFFEPNQKVEQYRYFMRETGLFDLLENKIISNLVDYVTGVETGLNTNARKNRGGILMESVVEEFIKDLGLPYEREIQATALEIKHNLNLGPIINQGKSNKRFDFSIETREQIYLIETNFYASSGSKLNETARSYNFLAQESKNIPGITFVWITDGRGWLSAKNSLRETFDTTEYLYNINDLKNGALEKLTENTHLEE